LEEGTARAARFVFEEWSIDDPVWEGPPLEPVTYWEQETVDRALRAFSRSDYERRHDEASKTQGHRIEIIDGDGRQLVSMNVFDDADVRKCFARKDPEFMAWLFRRALRDVKANAEYQADDE
jgi:hypothetical protein